MYSPKLRANTNSPAAISTVIYASNSILSNPSMKGYSYSHSRYRYGVVSNSQLLAVRHHSFDHDQRIIMNSLYLTNCLSNSHRSQAYLTRRVRFLLRLISAADVAFSILPLTDQHFCRLRNHQKFGYASCLRDGRSTLISLVALMILATSLSCEFFDMFYKIHGIAHHGITQTAVSTRLGSVKQQSSRTLSCPSTETQSWFPHPARHQMPSCAVHANSTMAWGFPRDIISFCVSSFFFRTRTSY